MEYNYLLHPKDGDANQEGQVQFIGEYKMGWKYNLNKFQKILDVFILEAPPPDMNWNHFQWYGLYPQKPGEAFEWNRLPKPVLESSDTDVRWWENRNKLFKSYVIRDEAGKTGINSSCII